MVVRFAFFVVLAWVAVTQVMFSLFILEVSIMSLHTGIIKSVRPIVAEDNSYAFIAFDLGSSNGKTLACQVWNNVPKLYDEMFNNGESLLHHKVRVKVSTYSAGSYKTKQGEEKQQLRMKVVELEDLGIPTDADEVTGVVRSGRLIRDPKGAYEFLSLDIVTAFGVTYAGQMWDNDPQYVQLGPIVQQLEQHKVAVNIVDWSFSNREYNGKKSLQARFRISNVRDLGFVQEN